MFHQRFLNSFGFNYFNFHGADHKIFKVMWWTLPWGTLGSIASSLETTIYQGNHDDNAKHWNIASTERYILYMQKLLIQKVTRTTEGNNFFCVFFHSCIWHSVKGIVEVKCYCVRYDFRINRCSIRLFRQLFVWRLMSYLRYSCLLVYSEWCLRHIDYI